MSLVQQVDISNQPPVLSNGHGTNGHDQTVPAAPATPISAPTSKQPKKKRYSQARYGAAIVEEVVQQRSPDAILDAIEYRHPGIARRPPYLMHDIRVAALARRLRALGASSTEVLGWTAKF
jgi:hypothetical protein